MYEKHQDIDNIIRLWKITAAETCCRQPTRKCVHTNVLLFIIVIPDLYNYSQHCLFEKIYNESKRKRISLVVMHVKW